MTHLTQFPNRQHGRACILVIGLDFGTSCTKVVVRSPYERARAFAVPFEDAAHHSSPYLLPSVLWIRPDGEASLSKNTKGTDALYLRDIKYLLMQSKPIPAIGGGAGEGTFDAFPVTVAFLALALRRTRGWFLDTQERSYGSLFLDWQINIGLPSADFADETLCQNYRRIAAAAWHLSVQDCRIDLSRAETACRTVKVEEVEPPRVEGFSVDCGDERSADVKLIPEVAAEVVGYARSHLREEGLHILMDIGASTLDVCSFILHKSENEDDCYELLTADVRELGAMILHRQRVSGVRESVTQHVDTLWDRCDSVSPVPEVGAYPPPEQQLLTRLEDSDATYCKQCSQMLWRTLIDLRTKRDPRSMRWKSEMPLFISGGASGMALYRASIKAISEEMKKMFGSEIQPLPLTKPENLEADVNDNGYHRLAVAWGLSYPDTDIGTVTRPCDIDDIPPRRPVIRKPFVSKDMV